MAKIKHRRTIFGYIFDAVERRDAKNVEIQKEQEISKKNREPSKTYCDSCGKLGTQSKCTHKSFWIGECNKHLCKKCTKKINGKHYCFKHA